MRYFPLVVLTALAACTSVEDMRTHDPRATYASTKSPLELARCFGAEIKGHGEPQIWPTDAETTVAFRPQGNTVLLVSIRPTDAGSDVTVWQKLGYMARPAVERCI